MPLTKLKNFLDEHRVNYQLIPHTVAYTAQGTAAAAHVHGQNLAKTVIVDIDGKLAMVVMPATHKLRLDFFRDTVNASVVQVAEESQFADLFPGCEVGAMPPFGNLFGMPVYVDESLTEDEEIAFNAGSHTELLQLRYEDFSRLVEPKVIRIVPPAS
ncbi:MAG: YbaK/EbsC family protein [Phycisphaerales bacterium]|nr:YbaK/EbsC family protein [Phycisphaerales bacterium]